MVFLLTRASPASIALIAIDGLFDLPAGASSLLSALVDNSGEREAKATT
jgi:hypothetical protein